MNDVPSWGVEREARVVDVDALVERAPRSPLPADAYEALLALADDEFVIGHRHSEWLGLSPFLEEDLTLASIAQDELGHARALYALIWPDWNDRDAGVTRRPGDEWRSSALCESAGQPWERALVRHLVHDVAEPHRWAGLREQFGAVVPGLDALVSRVLVEERFHRRHAIDLVLRLSRSIGARTRLQHELDALTPLLGSCLDGMTAAGIVNFLGEFADICLHGVLSSDLDLAFADRRMDRHVRSAEFGGIQRALVDVVGYDPHARW